MAGLVSLDQPSDEELKQVDYEANSASQTYHGERLKISPEELYLPGAIDSAERVFQETRRVLNERPDLEISLLHLEPGESLGEAQPGNQLFKDKVLIVLEGELQVQGSAGEMRLPAGYTIMDLASLAHHFSGNQVQAKQAVELLVLPRAEFEQLMDAHPDLESAIAVRIQESHPAQSIPDIARDLIRQARDQNIQAVLTREAIWEVNRPDGILQILNPEKEPISAAESESGARSISAIEQTWRLVWSIAPVLLHAEKNELREIAAQSRARAESLNLDSAKSTSTIAEYIFHSRVAERQQQMMIDLLPNSSRELEANCVPPESINKVAERVLQIRWLEQRAGDRQPNQDICKDDDWDCAMLAAFRQAEQAGTGLRTVLEALDSRLERCFNRTYELGLSEFEQIRIRKLDAELCIGYSPGKILPAEHCNYGSLVDLDRRLARGESSAVGGAAYAEMRFPKVCLDAIASRELPVIFYDGAHENGLQFLRGMYGFNALDPAVLKACTIVDLGRVYGVAGPRAFEASLVVFKGPAAENQFGAAMLVSCTGEDRQLSNAAAMLLSRDAEGNRIGPACMLLARDKQSAADRVAEDLRRLLEGEEEAVKGSSIHGQIMEDSSTLPTQVLIMQHQDQFIEALGEDLVVHEMHSCNIGKMYVGYWKNPDGEITRLLIPTVGSHGLYGDTAGAFVAAAFENVREIIPHLHFVGTAAGISGTEDREDFKSAGVRGMPERAPGGFFTVLAGVSDHKGFVELHTLENESRSLRDPDIQIARDLANAAWKAAQGTSHDRHYCFGCPAEETDRKIAEISGHGGEASGVGFHSSCDIELGKILRALEAWRERHPERPRPTCNQKYIFSDDPNDAKNDNMKTLAYGAPIADVKRVPELYQAVKADLELSHYVYRTQRHGSSSTE